MNRDRQIANIRAAYEGTTAGLQWLLNELYYFNEADMLTCEHCGDKFWVSLGDFVRLGSRKKGTAPFIRGGWAGRKSPGGSFPNLCENCLQAVHKKVEKMKKDGEDTA